MIRYRSFIHRSIVAGGLAAAVLGAAALGGPVAGADPGPIRNPARPIGPVVTAIPSLSAIHVQVGGHDAIATFTSSEPAAVTYELKAASAAPPSGPLGGVRPPLGGVLTAAGDALPLVEYKTQHRLHLKPLKSGTTYDLFVTATTQSGQRLTGQARFTTLKERVRVTLEHIDIEDDGDSWARGDGDPRWTIDVSWGPNTSRQCYPTACGSFSNHGEGRFVPRDANGNKLAWGWSEEIYSPLPNALTISVQAEEDDDLPWTPSQISTARAECRLAGTEATSTQVQVRGDQASRDFRSLLTFTCERYFDDTFQGIS